MKRIFALILALAVVLSCSAVAAEIKPMLDVDMENIDDCILNVGFNADDITEMEIFALVYDDMIYDAVEVSQLAVGDTFVCADGDVLVDTLDVDGSSVEINGGFENGGISLYANNEGGTYTAYEWELPVYMVIGQAQLSFADEVVYSHWTEDEDGAVSDEMEVQTVAAAEMVNVLTDGSYVPENTTVRMEGGKVVEVTVDYIP